MSNDDITTKPTIETVLERINTLGQELGYEIQTLRTEMQSLRESVDVKLTELSSGLRKIERKIGILNDSFLTFQADQRDLEVRIEKLEPKI